MKTAIVSLAMLTIAGCVSTPQDLAADPATPRLELQFGKDWRSTYQAINAASLQCTPAGLQSSEDTATATGTIAAPAGFERLSHVITVRPDSAGTGSTVTILMPMHEAKQRQTWPKLLELWVNQDDRATCPADVWRS